MLQHQKKIIDIAMMAGIRRLVTLATILFVSIAVAIVPTLGASAAPSMTNDTGAAAIYSSPTAPQPPEIILAQTYTQGVFVYFRIYYSDPGNDAAGFGFEGVNGSGWAEENHPFSSPSYGIVAPGMVDYPFNLECGTAQQYDSSVEAWTYDTAGDRSNLAIISLSCTAPSTPVTPTASQLPDLLTSPELPECVISLGALATGYEVVRLVAEGAAVGAALEAWHGALELLASTGDLAVFLNALGIVPYWQAALAGLAQPLYACFDGVQILLHDTAGQAGSVVGTWLRDNLNRYIHQHGG
jgi:hypothetical protein